MWSESALFQRGRLFYEDQQPNCLAPDWTVVKRARTVSVYLRTSRRSTSPARYYRQMLFCLLRAGEARGSTDGKGVGMGILEVQET